MRDNWSEITLHWCKMYHERKAKTVTIWCPTPLLAIIWHQTLFKATLDCPSILRCGRGRKPLQKRGGTPELHIWGSNYTPGPMIPTSLSSHPKRKEITRIRKRQERWYAPSVEKYSCVMHEVLLALEYFSGQKTIGNYDLFIYFFSTEQEKLWTGVNLRMFLYLWCGIKSW